MDHRRSLAGYHSSSPRREGTGAGCQDWTFPCPAGLRQRPGRRFRGNRLPLLAAALLLSSAAFAAGTATHTREGLDPSSEDVASARRRVLEQVNLVRGENGLPPLTRDPRLELVGDTTAEIMLEDRLIGHVARDGVPSFVRWALAGGSGFHVENAGAFETTGSLAGDRLGDVLVNLTDGMLAEKPPDDGHRRALLDPWTTHMGVGVAARDGRVIMNHQLAVHVVEEWLPPRLTAEPGTTLQLAGRLPASWQAVGLQIRRDSLPQPADPSETRLVMEIHYPPQAAMFPAGAAQSGPGGRRLWVDEQNGFWASWRAASQPGVEVALLWAKRRMPGAQPIPVALAVTVVLGTSTLPDHLVRWTALRDLDAVRNGP